MRSPSELCELYRSVGRKVTPQRLRIFEVLHGNRSHPTAESVFDQVVKVMPTVSLKTVYHTLNELAELGEILDLDLGTGAARFDPNTDSSHQHLVCVSCGKVEDVSLDVRAWAEVVERLDDFHVLQTQVVFRGTCSTCEPHSLA